MNKSLRVILVCLVFSMFACKRTPQKITGPDLNQDSAQKVQSVAISNIDFNYFSSKSKLTFKDADNDVAATLHLRIKKDSVIWININHASGIEAARGVITPDSIVIVNKLAKEYYIFTFEELTKKFNFKMDYKLLQSLVMGNTPYSNAKNQTVVAQGDYSLMQQMFDTLKVDNYINSKTNKLEKLVFSQPNTSNSLTVNYAKYEMVDQVFFFPFICSVSLDYFINGKKLNTFIHLDHIKPEFTDRGLKFPFNIPNRYDRK